MAVPQASWTLGRSVATLLVLFLASALNQADRWVFPALAPAGLRCHVPSSGSCNNTNSSSNGTSDYWLHDTDGNDISSSKNISGACAHVGCIDFNSYDQGILTGPAFAAVYVLSGVPLSRLADTTSRLLVLTIGLTFWSGMVLATGFVQTTWQLYLTRMGLGIGEATCNPVAYSLLADCFDPRHRSLAIAIYSSGIYVGASLGNLSGIVDNTLCWRWIFKIMGIAGCVLLPFLFGTLYGSDNRKPTRGSEGANTVKGQESQDLIWRKKKQLTLKQTLMELFRCWPYMLLVTASALRLVGGYALGAWSATFYHEHFGEHPQSYGLKLCMVFMIGGLPGSILGGLLADRLAKYGIHWKAYVIAFTQMIAVPLAASIFLMKSSLTSYIMFTVSFLFSESWFGIAAAMVQDLHVPAVRCQASAVFIAVGTLVGCVGPVLVSAVLSHQEECHKNYKWAMLSVVPTAYIASAVMFLITAITAHCGRHHHQDASGDVEPHGPNRSSPSLQSSQQEESDDGISWDRPTHRRKQPHDQRRLLHDSDSDGP